MQRLQHSSESCKQQAGEIGLEEPTGPPRSSIEDCRNTDLESLGHEPPEGFDEAGWSEVLKKAVDAGCLECTTQLANSLYREWSSTATATYGRLTKFHEMLLWDYKYEPADPETADAVLVSVTTTHTAPLRAKHPLPDTKTDQSQLRSDLCITLNRTVHSKVSGGA